MLRLTDTVWFLREPVGLVGRSGAVCLMSTAALRLHVYV